ncbi:heme utilization cystosolic carrier protein HutX [Cetobacterium somerae]|jgi:heme iron utilization protein|uniref:heme utilization cystosolic carrier protein HutX n=1 Tax=Cetobacterium somerae TaxID=188913 RepID=UPI00211F3927|nr:heme utilization cystosolic carrier protein HutX [Cetobacterium somerae]MCQ9625388.1 heme utilization cystosolic carrier protein HutX [Cetobacterium somerae]
MKNKINEILVNDEKASLNKIAKELDISMIEVLREAPTVKKYDIEKIDELFDVLRGWEKVFLLVVTPSFVLEIQDKFPKGFYAHGFLNFHDKNSTIGGHLSVGKIKEIFLVKDIMFGRESYSIKFFGEDEKEIFAVYVPRNEKKELIEECLESFKSL